ncbi:hypothetical protein TNIN_103501 [Trichonephila inaurata madagascariensis]|uniref:Uncharacterized protein n=1 Tax=Trichonephila inaurata madagascariensis TaxID=2747483 RepID=A0A8X7CHW8_9ARAC|nr:hypothetical protein TNIN_103501 [Trichonephila inaurata madagascariensis]
MTLVSHRMREVRMDWRVKITQAVGGSNRFQLWAPSFNFERRVRSSRVAVNSHRLTPCFPVKSAHCYRPYVDRHSPNFQYVSQRQVSFFFHVTCSTVFIFNNALGLKTPPSAVVARATEKTHVSPASRDVRAQQQMELVDHLSFRKSLFPFYQRITESLRFSSGIRETFLFARRFPC